MLFTVGCRFLNVIPLFLLVAATLLSTVSLFASPLSHIGHSLQDNVPDSVLQCCLVDFSRIDIDPFLHCLHDALHATHGKFKIFVSQVSCNGSLTRQFDSIVGTHTDFQFHRDLARYTSIRRIR